jgi:2-polyprenyl-3-methyl-5-hydroxy-6-metoxy-1,4-benzoquinol methylase
MPIITLKFSTLLNFAKTHIKSCLQYFLPHIWTSSNYTIVDDSHVEIESKRLVHAWENKHMPLMQRQVVDRELNQYRLGKKNLNFDSIVDAIKIVCESSGHKLNVLEIGCSSGYYSEVLSVAGLDVIYSGVDYSESFIQMAREYYPHLKFDVQDARDLNFPDNSFETVISGCCLLHIPEYEKAIAESVRVSSKAVIFHRTPVVWGEKTKYYRKYAYGVETIEIHFNENDFLISLDRSGLKVTKTYVIYEFGSSSVGQGLKTYLCEKLI